METCITCKKLESARQKIEQMNQLKDMILDGSLRSGTLDANCAFNLIDAINELQIKSSYILDHSQELANEIVSNANEIITQYIPTQQVSRDVTVGDVVTGIGNIAGGVLNGVQSMSTGVLSMAEPLATGIIGTAAKVVSSIDESTKAIASSVLNMSQNQANTITNQVNKTVQTMCAQTGNVVGTLTSTANDVLGKVFNGDLKSAANSINNVLNASGNGVSNLTSVASSLAKNLVSNGVNESQNLISSASNLAGNILSASSNIVGNIGGSSGIIGQTSSLITNLVGNSANDMLKTMFDSGGTITSTLNGAVGGVLGSASDFIKNLGGNNASDILKMSSEKLGEVTNSIIGTGSSGVSGLASGIVSGAANMVSSITGNATNAIGNILGASTNIAGNILNSATGLTSSMLNTAKNIGGNLLGEVGKLASGGSSLVGGVMGLAGSTLGSAADLAKGVLGTATNIASGVIGAVGDIASGVIDVASSAIDSIFGNSNNNGQGLANSAAQQTQNITNSVANAQQNLDPSNQSPQTPPNANPPQTPSSIIGGDTTLLSNVSNKEITSKFTLKEKKETTYGWKGTKPDFSHSVLPIMRDGDQQIFNPYGHSAGRWTRYSFRPEETTGSEGYPQIAITPSSFQALSSINELLNKVPYVVIREYFFKNTASTMMNIVSKILNTVQDKGEQEGIFKPVSTDNNGQAGTTETNSQGGLQAVTEGIDVFSRIKGVFNDVTLGQMTIDIPYILYCGLRKRMYGNTYVFPYIVNQSTIINQAANTSEWQKGAGGILGSIREMIGNVTGMVAGIASTLSGSQARGANLFPAPSWGGPGEDKISFSFDLILINDHVVKSRNNYMCVNTIINNNRSIQKAIFAFPGALYELWLPTGQRHMMCTGDFKLYPLGLNRQTPNGFFSGKGGPSGADFQIGTSVTVGDTDGNTLMEGAKLENPHQDGQEVIPDAYKLSMTFTSCLANNLNTAIFQYYCKMIKYDIHATALGGEEGINLPEAASAVGGMIKGEEVGRLFNNEKTEGGITLQDGRRVYSRSSDSSNDSDEMIEKFDESTYNKKLQNLRASLGDISMTSDSAVITIRKANDNIFETKKFLAKLYNAEKNNLWYKKFEKEEYYTTLNPNYSQALRKQYGEKLNELKTLDKQISDATSELQRTNEKLSTLMMSFDERQNAVQDRVVKVDNLHKLQASRTNLVDDMLQIDSQMISYAFDKHDDVVSIKQNEITNNIFNQVWNEKIMNSYEKEKIQYMTSKEKTRYFQKKIRELKKFDTYHILNHRDWFFRVTVLDYIVEQMEELINLFKNCAQDDYETVYKVVRKLHLLELDLDDVRNNEQFNINKTNLFHLSDKAISEYTKIDSLLNGSTLYELFQSQISLEFFIPDEQNSESNEPIITKDKELLQEQRSEIDIDKRRSIRDDIVLRVWGSEEALTQKAYEMVNRNPDKKFDNPINIGVNGVTKSFTSLKEMKDRIIQLKLDGVATNELQVLLGSFANQINIAKEGLIIQHVHDMVANADSELTRMSDDINAKVELNSSQNE